MRSRIISLSLPKTEYERLCRSAEADERDPVQQARWILKQALAQDQREQPDGGYDALAAPESVA